MNERHWNRDSIQSRVIDLISENRRCPGERILPSTDVVYELGTVGDDGWELLDRIAGEFGLSETFRHKGSDLYARFGDEATLPFPPLNFVVSLISGGAIWATRIAGLHKKRIEEVVIWPPWRAFGRKREAPLLVSEIVDRVTELSSISNAK